MDKETLKKIEEPIKSASEEIQKIVVRVLECEKDKLYMDRPRIVDDIVEIIKEEVRDEITGA